MIYLDSNATTSLPPEVLDAMLPWLREGYANPSGSYAAAKLARKAIEQAREKIAVWIGAQPGEIIFTGGGTESVNTALRSLDALTGPGHGVVSSIEHSAVLRQMDALERNHVKVAVTAGGQLDLEAYAASLEGASFVSVMTANNETGVIQPIDAVVAAAKHKGLPVHTDAIQAAGKIPLDVKKSGVDMLSISAHKFHGPKGVGALYVRDGLRYRPLLEGGGQESGRRSGTENTAGIVGMAAAIEWLERQSVDTAGLRDVFEARVMETISGVTVNGDVKNRLSNTSHLSFDRCEAAGLLILLDEAGVACAAGSACMTGKQNPSHVQLAMGIPEERAKSSLRISFSRLNTMDEALKAAEILAKVVEKLRRVQGMGVGPVSVYSP